MRLKSRRFVCTIALLLSLISCQYTFAEVLILPSALREIGIEAFSGDTSLDEVVLPEGLERIGAAAFKGSSVRRIYLPASLSDIAPDAFEGCSDIAGYGPDETYASRYFDETEGLHFEQEEDDCISIMIGTKVFEAELADNETGRAFADLLPLMLDMKELNGNEKYCYLNQTLPSSPERIGQIRTGDLMLYGNNCVVLFYKDFSTQYSYTRIGRIDDISGLQTSVGSGSVQIQFIRKNGSE